MLVLDNCELVNGVPVVVVQILEIEHTGLCATNCTVGSPVLHRDAIHEHAMEGPIAGFQCWPFWVGQFAKGIVQRFGGKIRVEPGKGITQALLQHHLSVVGALCVQRIGGDIGPVGDTPPEALQPAEGGFLDDGFSDSEARHCPHYPDRAQGTSSTSPLSLFL